MARKIVTVDEGTLRLPTAVEAALKADLETTFSEAVVTAETASSQAQGAAAAAQQAAEKAQAPTDEAVASRLRDEESATYAAAVDLIHDNVGVGYDVIPLLGQSNMVGRGLPLDAENVDTTDPRVFAFPAQGEHAGRIILARDPLMHWGNIYEQVGPGMEFARWYARTISPRRRVLLVPCAQGATSFSAGDKRWRPDWTPEHENLYLLALRQIRSAMEAAGPGAALRGFLWHQGEGDGSNPNYADELDGLIGSLREDLGVPDAWFIVGQMSPAGVALDTGKQTTNAIHIDTPRRVERTAFAPAAYGKHNQFDTTHLSAEGARLLGRNYAEAVALARANVIGTDPISPGAVRQLVGNPGELVIEWTRPVCRFTDFVIEHKASTDSEWTPLAGGTSLHNQATITGYAPGTTVEVRVATVNEEGTSAFGGEYQFTPTPYLTDLAPSAPWRCYGLRRIVAGYDGYCIRVVRASDNGTLDIGFDADGNLDEEALRTFCAGTDGYVRAWYDQVGAFGLSSLTSGQQPMIVDGGTVLKENGRPVMAFDGVDDYMYSGTTGLTTSGMTAVLAGHIDQAGSASNARIFSEGNTGNDTPQYTFYTISTGAIGSQFINDAGTTTTAISDDVWFKDRFGIFQIADDKSEVVYTSEQRVMDPQARTISGTATFNRFTLGARGRTTITDFTKMTLSELAFWQTAITPADLEDFTANQRGWFSL